MTAKCTRLIGMPEASCGKRRPELKSGLLRSFASGVVFFGSADAQVYAVDAASGRTRWVQKLGGRIYSTIYAAEHQLYVGCGDGKVYCLDASSGKILWSTPTGNGIDSSPAVAERPGPHRL